MEDDVASRLLLIGRFSRLTKLSIKALRLYDGRGLLRPAMIDFSSGYGYYHPSPAVIAEGIRRLRSVEMPLDAIGELLGTDAIDASRRRLAEHRKRLEERVSVVRQALVDLHRLDLDWSATKRGAHLERDQQQGYQCSFCGEDNTQAKRLIAGPKGVFICDDCVRLCNDILAKEEATART